MQVSESMALLNVLFCWLGAYIAVRRPGKRCGASRRIKKSFKHVIGTDRECKWLQKASWSYLDPCLLPKVHTLILALHTHSPAVKLDQFFSFGIVSNVADIQMGQPIPQS
jgi:hypothetical protein